MKISKTWLIVAVFLAMALAVMTVEASEEDYDYIKRCRDESRRRLSEYIEMLHSKTPPMPYEFIVQRISWSEDPRAIEPMMEVLADTQMYKSRWYDPYVIAAEFLGRMGDKRAIPILKKNLALVRWAPKTFAESTAGISYDDANVRLACAAALCELGELQDALVIFRTALNRDYPDPYSTAANFHRAVNIPLDPYRDRPEALDTICQFFREAAESKNAELRAGAAGRLIGIDPDLAFRVASEVVALYQPKKEEDIHRWYHILMARRAAVIVLAKMGDARSKQILQSLVLDPEEWIRETAESALRILERR